MNALGERLKEARQRKGWSQTFVCEQLKISNSRLSGYERNYREPDTKMLTTLASFYQVSVDWLTGLSNQHTHPKSSTTFQDPEVQRWYKNLPAANENDVKKLMRIWEVISVDEKS